ncbi:hypothetical protein RRG08_018675 [Elysia crispata]|uniref:Uncharacterized protein n=1 Tax=Elysia crispata TaxID=231223 RepID=A0AAE1CPY9_9GAST|nr:hypothetical protein RRG08_018675 [Elysia crispata]
MMSTAIEKQRLNQTEESRFRPLIMMHLIFRVNHTFQLGSVSVCTGTVVQQLEACPVMDPVCSGQWHPSDQGLVGQRSVHCRLPSRQVKTSLLSAHPCPPLARAELTRTIVRVNNQLAESPESLGCLSDCTCNTKRRSETLPFLAVHVTTSWPQQDLQQKGQFPRVVTSELGLTVPRGQTQIHNGNGLISSCLGDGPARYLHFVFITYYALGRFLLRPNFPRIIRHRE